MADATEWTAARSVIDSFDERLHDLRRYGFSFITGLLSLDAIFATMIPPAWKLAALIATLFLIVSLDLIDRNYRVFQLAAAIDAEVLERRSDVNLTQTITRIYDLAHVKFFFQIVYVMFALATLLLGWFIFPGTFTYHLLVFAAFAFAAFDIAWFVLYREQYANTAITTVVAILVSLSYAYYRPPNLSVLVLDLWRPKLVHYHFTLLVATMIAILAIIVIEWAVDVHPWIYFGIDQYQYEQRSDCVSVIVSNIGPTELNLNHREGSHLTVHTEDDQLMKEPIRVPELEGPRNIRLPAGSKRNWRLSWSDHRWSFPAKRLNPGLYRLVYHGPIYSRVNILGVFSRYRLLDPNKTKIMDYDPWKVAQRFTVVSRGKIPRPDGTATQS